MATRIFVYGVFLIVLLAGMQSVGAEWDTQEILTGSDAAIVGDTTSKGQGKEKELPVRTIQTDDMKFADPKVGVKLRCFERMAKELATPAWFHRPFSTLAHLDAQGVYYATWATLAHEGGAAWNYRGPKDLHCVSLGARFVPKGSEEIIGVALNALWRPGSGGRSASLTYATFGGQPPKGREEQFFVSFMGRSKTGDEAGTNPQITLDYHGRHLYQSSPKFEGVTYNVEVHTHEPVELSRLSKVVSDAEVKRILASPEAMRDFLLASYLKLQANIEVDIPSRKAIKWAKKLDRIAPKQNQLSDRKMTEKEKLQVLAEARAKVELQIKVVRQDYQEMYTALRKAFPIMDCLKDQGMK